MWEISSFGTSPLSSWDGREYTAEFYADNIASQLPNIPAQIKTPVTVTYELTPYSGTLGSILNELRLWGIQHRKHIVELNRAQ